MRTRMVVTFLDQILDEITSLPGLLRKSDFLDK